MRARLSRIARFRAEPLAAQAAQLRYLLGRAQATEVGRQYGFRADLSPTDFARRVAVQPYEALYPMLERVLRGEADVLWPGRPRWFAKSSGTTNARSKYIPVTPEALHGCHYRGGKDMLALFSGLYPQQRIFHGQGLSLGGAHEPNPWRPAADGSRCGDVSAVIVQNLPGWAQFIRSPPVALALLADWDEKIEKLARHTARQNITSLAGVPTWTVVLIRRILALTGARYIREVWPNLELFAHGAVAFGPYRALFHELIPPDQRDGGRAPMRYLEIYNASEGFFGLQDQADSEDLLLLLDYGIYYEFLPLDQLGQPAPQALPLEGVEVGKSYALVISTSAGLWRYLVGDTVRFTSVRPYRFRISGRTKHFLNAFGEEVVVENAEAAVAAACRATNATLTDFTAAPVYLGAHSRGGHEWIVEFSQPPDELARFTQALDESLRLINSDYDAKRQYDLALVAPRVHVAPAGTFAAWLRTKGKLGAQHKVPRLANDRTLLEELLEIGDFRMSD
ncbi:MAG: GH3 auxin-responsive promoter family protein [Hymenobacteraceae bacterium]|nr:GH3 auxin-responsive promoter family protein [Hymenobacteraceae bacterium]